MTEGFFVCRFLSLKTNSTTSPLTKILSKPSYILVRIYITDYLFRFRNVYRNIIIQIDQHPTKLKVKIRTHITITGRVKCVEGWRYSCIVVIRYIKPFIDEPTRLFTIFIIYFDLNKKILFPKYSQEKKRRQTQTERTNSNWNWKHKNSKMKKSFKFNQ